MTMDCSAGGRPPGGSKIKIVEATCTQGQACPPLCLEKKQHGGMVPPNKHLVTNGLEAWDPEDTPGQNRLP